MMNTEKPLLAKTKNSAQKLRYVMIMLALVLLAVFLASFTFGRYFISLSDLFTIVGGKILHLNPDWPPVMETVIFNVRMPRILAALMVGAALSVAGTTYQGYFKNPMVSPDILGATAGAGFGAALGILLSFNDAGIQIISFTSGITAVALTYAVSSVIGKGNHSVLSLVLTGMVVATLFSAFISITKYVADPDDKLPVITFWLLGSLSGVTAKDETGLLIPIVLGVVPIFLLKWRLNVLSFGEEEAESMGIDTRKTRAVFIVCSTILTASAVSVSGMIGWIGLVIPHIARLIVGPDHKVLLPASFLIGSAFLMIVDDIARTAFSTEIPLGILTAIIGAPFFLFLLSRGKKGWL